MFTTNLSSVSFKILLSSMSAKLSWPATTVLLLDVVPIHVKSKVLLKIIILKLHKYTHTHPIQCVTQQSPNYTLASLSHVIIYIYIR